MMNYELGGNEVPVSTSESISDIPYNKTLIVEKLTADDPVSPEIVTGLTDIQTVFEHFSPNIDIEFENEEGQPIKENLQFKSVADFLVKNLTLQSSFLRNLQSQKDFNEYLVKQLRTNKVLQKVLKDSDAKQAFLSILKELRKEVEESQKS